MAPAGCPDQTAIVLRMTFSALPPAFVERMRSLLGDEADSFLASLDRPPTAGLRVNTLKITAQEFQRTLPWELDALPWATAGFLVAPELRLGRHPLHSAGLFYLQEPSAMAVAEALQVDPGDLVLDLAAAPGGKTTHIASLLGGSGVLIANEMVGARIKPLGENLERWGAANTILLNSDPATLADSLGPICDRVLLDAPCSGEGMFRKSPVAIREWSLAHVAGSAARQCKILDDAARLVRPGGLLLYSTCTFNPEENEVQIARFLERHPDWEIGQAPMRDGMTQGRPDWGGGDPRLAMTARIWPHLSPGEGHVLALLQKSPATRADESRPASENYRAAGSGGIAAAWLDFAAGSLNRAELDPNWLDASRLVEQSGTLFLVPAGAPPLNNLRVVRPGLPLGMARPGRFEPAHALALALRPGVARDVVDLDRGQTERYLEGHQLEIPGPSGWAVVTHVGHSLGWGRRSGGVVKNHYPKGLRRAAGWP